MQKREISIDSLNGLYTVHGAARRLGISYAAADMRLRRKGILVVRLGSERLVRLQDVQDS